MWRCLKSISRNMPLSPKIIKNPNKLFGKGFSKTPFLNVEIFDNANDAIKDMKDGSFLTIGGFGNCGIPENLLKAVRDKKVKNLILATCTAQLGGDKPEFGLGQLFYHKQVKKIISSYIGEHPECQKQYNDGDIEVVLTPQGTLAEKMRSGGAGIGAFYTATGYGTLVHKGGMPIKYKKDGSVDISSTPKEERNFKGLNYILEESLRGDFALVKAWKADKYGNVIFNKSARNFNVPAAKAAKICIVEVEEISDTHFDPEKVHLPGAYVQRLLKGKNYVKIIERIETMESYKAASEGQNAEQQKKLETIVKRVACEFKNGMYVNLGIGIPILASNFLPKGVNVTIQSENGLLGQGRYPYEKELDADLTNAGKQSVTVNEGASFFSSDESFAMIRGSHLAISVLGAFQVSSKGDLANYMIPKILVKGMGGAMDLVSAHNTKIIVCMEHVDKKGNPKIVETCKLPLTGVNCVNLIVTELAVFSVDFKKGLTLLEVVEGKTLDDIKKLTASPFEVSKNLCPMKQVVTD